jgi:hypothetical protein
VGYRIPVKLLATATDNGNGEFEPYGVIEVYSFAFILPIVRECGGNRW